MHTHTFSLSQVDNAILVGLSAPGTVKSKQVRYRSREQATCVYAPTQVGAGIASLRFVPHPGRLRQEHPSTHHRKFYTQSRNERPREFHIRRPSSRSHIGHARHLHVVRCNLHTPDWPWQQLQSIQMSKIRDDRAPRRQKTLTHQHIFRQCLLPPHPRRD